MAGLAARFNQDPAAVGAVAVAPPRVVLMLRLAAEAGLRRGEIARIHSTDLAGEQQGPVLLPASPIGRRRAPGAEKTTAAVCRKSPNGAAQK